MLLRCSCIANSVPISSFSFGFQSPPLFLLCFYYTIIDSARFQILQHKALKMNHSKTGSSPSSSSSSSSTRLSASAKPFTLKRSISGFHCPEPAIYSPDHTISDPFSSLLDSFPKFNLGAKLTSLASSFPNDAASQFQTQTQEESLPRFASVGLKGNDDYVVINGSDFDLHKDLSLPLYSSDFTGVGLGAFDGSELNYGKRGKDCHESLFSKGNDNGRSAAHGSVLQKGFFCVNCVRDSAFLV